MNLVASTEVLAKAPAGHLMWFLGYIVIGGLAGWLASRFIKGSGVSNSIVMDVVVGIIGALIGGGILNFSRIGTHTWPLTFLAALLGSSLLLWAIRAFRHTSQRPH